MSLVLGGVLVPGMNAMSVYAEGSAMGKGPVVLWMPRWGLGGGILLCAVLWLPRSMSTWRGDIG